MPGTSFVYDRTGTLLRERDTIERSLDASMELDRYTRKVIVAQKSRFLGMTAYGEYPSFQFESQDFLILLEGKIYGIPAAGLESHLSILAEIVFRKKIDYPGGAAGWIERSDGDFVVFVLEKGTDRTAVLNDRLGRLPLYICGSGGRLIVSRNLRFIRKLAGGGRLDREAVREHLLFGYPLGERTLFADISRLPPASFVEAGEGAAPTVRQLYRFDFGSSRGGVPDRKNLAGRLAESFASGCRARSAGGGRDILTLSGGLDSRAVAAGLEKSGTVFRSVTFLDHDGTAAADAEIAGKVAALMDIKWDLIEMGPATGADTLTLLKLKSGMNHLGMAFSLQFFRAVRAMYGSGAILFSGDGGDKALPDIRPPVRLDGPRDLVRYLVGSNGIMPLRTAAALTRSKPEEIEASLLSHVDAYPEREAGMKYSRFIVCERGMKWLFEGEDRNRHFYWTAAPFYSIPFFDLAMRVPFEMKSRHSLYRDFMMKLSPRLCAVENANWKMPLSAGGSGLYFLARSVYRKLPGPLRNIIKRRHKKSADTIRVYDPRSNMIACLRRQIERSGAISSCLDTAEIEKSLPGINRLAFDHLFTLTSLIEEDELGESSLSAYSDSTLV